MAIRIDEYLAKDGRNHFREWFNSLTVEYAAKVAAARARMMAGSLGNVKPIDGTLKEFRIDWGPGMRIYLIQDGDKFIVLLGGGTKGSQKADIQRARELRDEYDARKSASKKIQKG